MTVLAFVRDVVGRFPLLFLASTAFLIAEGLVGVVSIFSVAPIIDVFLDPGLHKPSPITREAIRLLGTFGVPATLWNIVAMFLAFQMAKNGFSILARHSLLRTKYAFLRELMVGTFEDFFRARWAFFSSSRQGTLLSTFLREIGVVGDAFGAMSLLFASLLQLLLYLAVPLYLSWQVTSVSFAVALLFALPFLLLGRVNYRLGRLSTATANETGKTLQENLTLAKVVLGFANQGKSVTELARAFDQHRRVTLRAQTLGFATPLFYEPLGMVVLFIALFVARRFAFTLSEIGVLFWAFRSCIPLLALSVGQRNTLANLVPSYEQLTDLRRRARELAQPSGDRPFEIFAREITLENLTVAHPGHAPTLVDINLRIPKGRMVAIVGESGAGKSTLVDLIMGFIIPTSGRIAFDGTPLQEFDITSYRRRVGYVPQESILFNTTIRENLRWAREDATEAEIGEACRQANASEFIEEFPEGYDTVVGDRGVRLSGGQCQRVALARAILRRPDLLILDEATSSLDTHSERLIQAAIETIAKETTVIIIAHRLSTIIHADYVYLLQKGRIAEEGTYWELVERNGVFTRMTEMQRLEAAAR